MNMEWFLMCVLSIELIGWKYMEKWKKNTISRNSRGLVPIPNRVVPVP